MQNLLCYGIHKVGRQEILSKLMYGKAMCRSAPLELAAIGAVLQGMQAHAPNSVSEVVNLLSALAEVLHHMIMPMQVNHLGQAAAAANAAEGL